MVQNTLRGPDWRKIQVSLEIAVEFVEFLNIDLQDNGLVCFSSVLGLELRTKLALQGLPNTDKFEMRWKSTALHRSVVLPT